MASKPTKQTTATALENARKALAQLEEEASGLEAARDKALLDGAPTAEAIQTNKQIDATRHAVQAEQRRVQLLEGQQEREKAEAAARRYENHVREFEKTLAQADVAGDELENAVAMLERSFRETIRLRELALSMWPSGVSSHSDGVAREPEGCALAGGAVAILLQRELHRVGTQARLLGGSNEVVKIPLPGGVPARLTPEVDRKTGQLVPLVPLGTLLRNASRFAVETLRDKKFVPPVVPQPEPKGPRLVFDENAVAPVQQQVQPPASPIPAPRPRAAAGDIDGLQEYIPPEFRERLGTLLGRLARLAQSGSDEAYEACGAELTALQDEIKRARDGEAA